MSNLPDITQSGIVITASLIILICLAFICLRSMARMVIGTVVLAVSLWVGFLFWQKAPELSVAWFGKQVPAFMIALPIVTALGSFLILAKLLSTMGHIFKGDLGEAGPIQWIFRILSRILLILVPATLLWLAAAVILHHVGSVSEVETFALKARGQETSPSAFSKFCQSFKPTIEAFVPKDILGKLDPLSTPNRIKLAKLVATQSDKTLPPAIDPKTGKPIPRAIIVKDPELQNLAKEKSFGSLLRHPFLTKALADPRIKSLLEKQSL